MKLPGGDRAIVDDAKVRDYLLAAEHPVGRFKARVFAAVGYERGNWPRLQADLRAAAALMEVQAEPTAFGQGFSGPAILLGPNGRPLPIVVVWIIRSGEDDPRFVTAYPMRPS